MADFLDYSKLNEAITAESEMPIITKWLTVFEGINEDGDRCVGYMSSEGCAVWDELGLIDFHRQHRAAQMAAD